MAVFVVKNSSSLLLFDGEVSGNVGPEYIEAGAERVELHYI